MALHLATKLMWRSDGVRRSATRPNRQQEPNKRCHLFAPPCEHGGGWPTSRRCRRPRNHKNNNGHKRAQQHATEGDASAKGHKLERWQDQPPARVTREGKSLGGQGENSQQKLPEQGRHNGVARSVIAVACAAGA